MEATQHPEHQERFHIVEDGETFLAVYDRQLEIGDESHDRSYAAIFTSTSYDKVEEMAAVLNCVMNLSHSPTSLKALESAVEHSRMQHHKVEPLAYESRTTR